MLDIKNIRLNLRLTQEKFAKELGVTRGVIAQIETGKNNPTMALLEKIKEVYGINIFDEDNVTKDNDSKNKFNTKRNNLLLADLTLLLEDNLKMLYVLCSIRKSQGSVFSKKEKEKLKFYFNLDSLLMDVRIGKERLSIEECENLEHIIKINLYSEINTQIYKVMNELNIDIHYNYDNLFD